MSKKKNTQNNLHDILFVTALIELLKTILELIKTFHD